MDIVRFKNLFSAISSIIIFVICRSVMSMLLMAKFMKKMLRQTFSVFEPKQGLEMGNYRYTFDRNFIIIWQMELVCLFFFCFFFVVFFVLCWYMCLFSLDRPAQISWEKI